MSRMGGEEGGQEVGHRDSSWEGEREFEDAESGGMWETYGPVVQEMDPACAERSKHSRPATAVLRKS